VQRRAHQRINFKEKLMLEETGVIFTLVSERRQNTAFFDKAALLLVSHRTDEAGPQARSHGDWQWIWEPISGSFTHSGSPSRFIYAS
jgi:hypothetical protein